MNKNKFLFLSFSLLLLSCSKENSWRNIFNEKDLEGWDTYIGPTYDSVKNKFDSLTVVGLNKDPNRVFAVVQVEGRPAIRISGEYFGGISTQRSFNNYHLRLEFKWGSKKWNPRKDKPRDSGVLYHADGKHGADFGFWMRSQEFQVEEGNTGDYWGVAGGSFDIPVTQRGDGFVYDPDGKMLTFNETSKVGRRAIKLPDAEKPTGEWNTLEIYCLGDTAVHVVNGQVNMILYHSAHVENGRLRRLDHGKIQIQSEGAEIFYRHIQLENIRSIPEAIIHHPYDPTWGLDFD
jgi:hypothetical protein